MRFATIALCVAGMVGPVIPAAADHAPTLVVPGRPDIPVIINGVDASWGVVEGDWGLYRPGHMAPTVIPSPIVIPGRFERAYYPSFGRAPRRGRLEIEPAADRTLPAPAESFFRQWGTQSDPVAAGDPPANPPAVIVAPEEPRRPRHRRP